MLPIHRIVEACGQADPEAAAWLRSAIGAYMAGDRLDEALALSRRGRLAERNRLLCLAAGLICPVTGQATWAQAELLAELIRRVQCRALRRLEGDAAAEAVLLAEALGCGLPSSARACWRILAGRS